MKYEIRINNKKFFPYYSKAKITLFQAAKITQLEKHFM